MTHSGLLMQSRLHGIDISPTVKLRESPHTLCVLNCRSRERGFAVCHDRARSSSGDELVINSLSLDFLDILPSISGLQSENRNASWPFVQNCFHRGRPTNCTDEDPHGRAIKAIRWITQSRRQNADFSIIARNSYSFRKFMRGIEYNDITRRIVGLFISSYKCIFFDLYFIKS